jgi:hypothetical protein
MSGLFSDEEKAKVKNALRKETIKKKTKSFSPINEDELNDDTPAETISKAQVQALQEGLFGKEETTSKYEENYTEKRIREFLTEEMSKKVSNKALVEHKIQAITADQRCEIFFNKFVGKAESNAIVEDKEVIKPKNTEKKGKIFIERSKPIKKEEVAKPIVQNVKNLERNEMRILAGLDK